ncbi:MAG: putative sugar nucleotidyl transferase [Candidatus Brocadiia bacterium]
MKGNIVLFEDHYVEDMRPVTLTRPAFGVTCAAYRLFDIAHMVADRVTYIVRHYLDDVAAQFFTRDAPDDGPTLFLNAAVAPDVRYVPRLRELMEAGEPFACASGQRVAAALVPPDESPPEGMAPADVTPYLLDMNLPVRDEEPFRTLDYCFDIVDVLEELFPANIRSKIDENGYEEVRPGVFVGDGVKIAETAVFHADEGPIVLADNVRVLDFTFFEGPVYVGPNSRIIERSSVKECVSVGHTCKIGGEVEASVIEPYTNKQHHGFLGHAYVGSWVNMGAGTSNSDLKNTYGSVRVNIGERRVETGMQFLGCIIGDYSKTAINTSIFTGKIIGVCSMLYGYVGQNVPSFCNYAKSFGQITECTLEQAIITQKRMFVRRDVEQTEADIALLGEVFERTKDERSIASEPPVL